MPHLRAAAPARAQRRQIDLIQAMTRDLAATPAAPDGLDGVIDPRELAFTMQDKVPALLDLSREPRSTLEEYGVVDGPTGSFARQCLMARRLSEAGVRFVEVCHPGWDQHIDLHGGLARNSAATDRPTAALLTDLKRRGLLDDTLVIFGSEFGRLPTAQGVDGRDHNIAGYPMWLAGAGVRPGFSFGATDEHGQHAVEGRMHTADLHATLLALMGLDHAELTYRRAPRADDPRPPGDGPKDDTAAIRAADGPGLRPVRHDGPGRLPHRRRLRGRPGRRRQPGRPLRRHRPRCPGRGDRRGVRRPPGQVRRQLDRRLHRGRPVRGRADGHRGDLPRPARHDHRRRGGRPGDEGPRPGHQQRRRHRPRHDGRRPAAGALGRHLGAVGRRGERHRPRPPADGITSPGHHAFFNGAATGGDGLHAGPSIRREGPDAPAGSPHQGM